MEILVRALTMYLFLWFVIRAMGRTTLGELSAYELIVYITMGDLVQQAVTQQDYSLTGSSMAISVFALCTVGLSWLQWRFPRTRVLVTGRPLVIVRDGRILPGSTRPQRLGEDDIKGAARRQGIESLDDVELAILESDGRISFFTQSDGSDSGSPEKADAG
jgi:uncharacterized membrane protein YcaP (DUF421 family)